MRVSGQVMAVEAKKTLARHAQKGLYNVCRRCTQQLQLKAATYNAAVHNGVQLDNIQQCEVDSCTQLKCHRLTVSKHR